MSARVAEHAAIPSFEEFHRADHRLAILGHDNLLDGIRSQRSRGDSGTQAQHEDILRAGSDQHRQMGQEELGAKISRRRGIGLAIDPQGAVRRRAHPISLFYRHRCVSGVFIR